MIWAQNTKWACITATASVSNNATSAGYIDTLGYDYATIDIILDSAATESNVLTRCLLMESTNAAVSSATNITAFVGWGTGGWTLPTAENSAAETCIRFNVDCTKRKRYLHVQVTPGTAARILGVYGNLSRAEFSPNTATLGGLHAVVNG